MTARDTPAFATRLLESNECDLIVPPGNQPVNLTVERLADGLHLTTGKAPVPTRGGSIDGSKDSPTKKKTPVAKGRVKITRSRSFPTDWLVTIKIDKTKAETINDIILDAGRPCIILDVAAGSYRLSATCTGQRRRFSAIGKMTTNKCQVDILMNQTVTLKLDRQADAIYLEVAELSD